MIIYNIVSTLYKISTFVNISSYKVTKNWFSIRLTDTRDFQETKNFFPNFLHYINKNFPISLKGNTNLKDDYPFLDLQNFQTVLIKSLLNRSSELSEKNPWKNLTNLSACNYWLDVFNEPVFL